MKVKGSAIVALIVVMILFVPAIDADAGTYSGEHADLDITTNGKYELDSDKTDVIVHPSVNATLDLNGFSVETLANFGNLTVIDRSSDHSPDAYPHPDVEYLLNGGVLDVVGVSTGILLNSGSATLSEGYIVITICIGYNT